MTDIQRHLKGIRKLLGRAVDLANQGSPLDVDAICQQLREYLPQGYGVVSGGAAGLDGTSLCIYDIPRLEAAGGKLAVEHMLLVLEIAVEYDEASFVAALERVRAVKAQVKRPAHSARKRSPEPVGQARSTIPKTRLPYAMIYFHHFNNAVEDKDGFALLSRLLVVHPHAFRPDEIIIIGQPVHYLNPLLEEELPAPFQTGLSRKPDFARPRACYVCKKSYFRQHFFYDRLCLKCGDLNYHKRVEKVSLAGYTALVTGARVKIGFETALRLLRVGAEVIALTRFPRDAAGRFAQEADFDLWHDRLHIYGIDLRQIGHLEQLIERLYERFPYLDILINNAAQTVKRPPAYYAHLLAFETAPLSALPGHLVPLLGEGQVDHSFDLSFAMNPALTGGEADPDFPSGEYDQHGQQVDKRSYNSWVMRLDEVPVSELLEVHLVNAVAPAVLAGRLKALMMQSPHTTRHIVNVSAAEGRFAAFKQGLHPHTDMAKAALNMLTRSIASDYAQSNIYVNSVDPGWVSDQTPRPDRESRIEALERLPIDLMDAAARICDPIFTSIRTGQTSSGELFKDYVLADW